MWSHTKGKQHRLLYIIWQRFYHQNICVYSEQHLQSHADSRCRVILQMQSAFTKHYFHIVRKRINRKHFWLTSSVILCQYFQSWISVPFLCWGGTSQLSNTWNPPLFVVSYLTESKRVHYAPDIPDVTVRSHPPAEKWGITFMHFIRENKVKLLSLWHGYFVVREKSKETLTQVVFLMTAENNNNCSLAIQRRLPNLSPQGAINKKGIKEWQSIWSALLLQRALHEVLPSRNSCLRHRNIIFHYSYVARVLCPRIAGEAPGGTGLLEPTVPSSSPLNHIHLSKYHFFIQHKDL